MPANTRQRLVDAATNRFYRDGFRNVAVDQVISDVGISKTAFYKHFESKDDLVLAALAAKDVWLKEIFVKMLAERAGPDAGAQIRAIFHVVEELIGSTEFHGCIFVNVAIEFPLPHEPAHRAAAEHKRAMEEIIRGIAERAGADEPTALARELCLVMEGLYVTKQVTGDSAAFDSARRIAAMAIDARLPQPA